MSAALPPELACHPDLWRKGEQHAQNTIPTGQERLNRALPGNGWPLGALTELLAERPGLGEFSLLLPALAHTTGRAQWSILIDPPWAPYPPAMQGHGVDLSHVLLVRTHSHAESLWACEQALRGLHGGAVLGWFLEQSPDFARLRRLQLAARTGNKLAFLFRPASVSGESSPAALRLHLQADDEHLQVEVLKCRGARPAEPLYLGRPHRPGPDWSPVPPLQAEASNEPSGTERNTRTGLAATVVH